MNRLLAIILIMGMTIGCATQQRYTIPSPKTQSDFLLDREECSKLSGYQGGHFLFGPLIIIFPVVIVLEIIKVNHQKDFQRCMIERGYKCADGCWDITASKPPPKTDTIHPDKEDKEIPPKSEENIRL